MFSGGFVGRLERITGRFAALVMGVTFCPLAFASYGGANGEFSGTLASAQGNAFTFGCYGKYPAGGWLTGEVLFEIGTSPTGSTNAHSLRLGSVADQYVHRSYDASAGSSATYSAASGTYDGVWHGIVGVNVTDADRDIYVAALANVANNTASKTIADVDDFTIGRGNNGATPWTGKFAECFIYNGEMSSADITAYMSGVRPDCLDGAANLVAYYSFSTDDDTPVDAPGNLGPALTLAGTIDYDADHPTMSCPSNTDAAIMMRRRM